MKRVADRQLQPLLDTGPAYYAVVGVLVALIAWGVYAYSRQLSEGLGVTGMNTPTYWGIYIVNFVFFVGLSAGGVFVASLVHAFNVQAFKSVARIAELLAISCLILATLFILLDLGKPERFYHLFIYGRLGSPLIWDVIVITVYLLVGLAYGYFGARADLLKCMEVLPRRRWLYRLLALGYTDGSESALRRDRRILRGLAIVALPLAVTLHSVTAWILGLVKARPGWYSPLIAPLFVVSATVSGLALVIVVVVLSKRLLKVAIGARVVPQLGTILAFLIPVLGYFLFAELLTVTFAKEPAELHVFAEMMAGRYAFVFWGNLILGLLVPLGLLVHPRTRTETGIAVAAALVVLGVLAERWNIVIPSQFHRDLPYPPGAYVMTWVEYSVVLGVYALGVLVFALLAKLFPLVELEGEGEGAMVGD
ncbi:MAG TPA: NrfD/PsrC family molybdoenzyme membrane anchor subunit [Alphaproteobacteria bacterium]|nr:NrfD/PsrC family molybdoenzyme membrane anchor subunit [Alphaproteobacteria bacterium]